MKSAGSAALAVAVAAGILGNAAATVDEDERAWFRSEGPERGLRFAHVSGHVPGRYLFPEIHAGGAALFDADADGDLDVYLVQSGGLEVDPAARPGNRLFLNRGDGTFTDATADSGAQDRGYGMGVTAGDYDGDGLVDLYVTNVGPNVLLRNLGQGRFEDMTRTAGVAGDGWSSSAAFVDYDLDGDLDLFVVHYLNWTVAGEADCFDAAGRPDYCGPAKYDSPAADVLYRNDGEGRFTEVTVAAGLDLSSGTGLGVVSGDFDANGWPDLFVANDNMLDQLWLNQGDGTFRDDAVFWGSAADSSGKPKAGMGVSAADVDDDGDLDLVVCNLAGETDSLFLNQGSYFVDRTGASGLAAISRSLTRFGMGWQDFDNDGILDLFQANGAIARQGRIYRPDDPYAEPNLLIRGRSGLRYREVLPRGGTAELIIETSRGAAFGDVDGDGGVDVLVVNRDGSPDLLMNRAPGRGRWLMVSVGSEEGSPALGAMVVATVGGRRLRRAIAAAYSYQTASDPTAHFGLGAAERVEQLEVIWPDGTCEAFGAQPAGRVLRVRRGEGAVCPEASS